MYWYLALSSNKSFHISISIYEFNCIVLDTVSNLTMPFILCDDNMKCSLLWWTSVAIASCVCRRYHDELRSSCSDYGIYKDRLLGTRQLHHLCGRSLHSPVYWDQHYHASCRRAICRNCFSNTLPIFCCSGYGEAATIVCLAADACWDHIPSMCRSGE